MQTETYIFDASSANPVRLNPNINFIAKKIIVRANRYFDDAGQTGNFTLRSNITEPNALAPIIESQTINTLKLKHNINPLQPSGNLIVTLLDAAGAVVTSGSVLLTIEYNS